MIAKTYNLPEVSFVGGESHDFKFSLFTDTGRAFNASDINATFSIVSSINRTGQPILSKNMTVIADTSGTKNIITVTLQPNETVNLYGKYIYQITLQDISGETEIPSQGILGIINNIDKNIIK